MKAICTLLLILGLGTAAGAATNVVVRLTRVEAPYGANWVAYATHPTNEVWAIQASDDLNDPRNWFCGFISFIPMIFPAFANNSPADFFNESMG